MLTVLACRLFGWQSQVLKCLLINLFLLSHLPVWVLISWTHNLKTNKQTTTKKTQKPNSNIVFYSYDFWNQCNYISITSHANTLLGTTLPFVQCMYGLKLSWGHLKLVCHFRQVTSYLLFPVSSLSECTLAIYGTMLHLVFTVSTLKNHRTVPPCCSELVIHTLTLGDFGSTASTEQARTASNNSCYCNTFKPWHADIGKAKWHQLNNNKGKNWKS